MAMAIQFWFNKLYVTIYEKTRYVGFFCENQVGYKFEKYYTIDLTFLRVWDLSHASFSG